MQGSLKPSLISAAACFTLAILQQQAKPYFIPKSRAYSKFIDQIYQQLYISVDINSNDKQFPQLASAAELKKLQPKILLEKYRENMKSKNVQKLTEFISATEQNYTYHHIGATILTGIGMYIFPFLTTTLSFGYLAVYQYKILTQMIRLKYDYKILGYGFQFGTAAQIVGYWVAGGLVFGVGAKGMRKFMSMRVSKEIVVKKQ